MENKSTLKLIFIMGLPPILSMLIQSLYSIVDAWYVAKISEEAFTAVSLVYPIQAILLSVAVGLGVAINGCIARARGRKELEKVKEFSIVGIFLTFIHYLLIIIVCLFVITPFINFNTSNQNISEMAHSYIRIVSYCSIGLLLNLTFEKILQGYGNMIVPTIAQILSCLLNIVLDHIFVLELGFGVTGAATATVISQISAGVGLMLFVIFNPKYPISIKSFKLSKENLLEIYKVCIPCTVMMSLPSILIMSLNVILNSISELYVNILNLFLKVQTFVFMPMIGLTQGIRPIISYFFGAKNPKRIKESLKYAFILMIGNMLIGVIIFNLIPSQLIKMFFDTPDMIYHGTIAFRIFSISFIFVAISYVFITFYDALGYSIVSLVINLCRQFIITLLLAVLLVYIFDLGAVGVWISIVTAEVLTAILALIFFKYTYSRTPALME